MSDVIIEPPVMDSNLFLNDQYPIKDSEVPTYNIHRRSESAEKYFGWARKTQRE